MLLFLFNVIICRIIFRNDLMKKLLAKIFNLNSGETYRVFYCWFLKFLYRIDYNLGWTVLVAYLVSRISIRGLPYLILTQALFMVLGMIIFSRLINKIEVKRRLLYVSIIYSVIIVFSIISRDIPLLFITLMVAGFGIFLHQINIFLSSYFEEYFTPWEAERAFPVIESAESIAGLSSGLFLALVSPFIKQVYLILYLLIVIVTIFLMVLFLLRPKSNEEIIHDKHKNEIVKDTEKRALTIKEIKTIFHYIINSDFLKTLLIVLIAQYFLLNVIEFQFTKVVDESEAVANGVMSHESNLLQGLGQLQIIFFSFALFVQLIAGSRLMHILGTFGGFLVHSILTLCGSFFLNYTGGSYFSSVIMKNNFEMSGVLYKNAYESSFFAFKSGTQGAIREFFEGIFFPVATMLGMALVIVWQTVLNENMYLKLLNGAIFIGSLVMFIYALKLQRSFTAIVSDNLKQDNEDTAKRHAIEILAQRGHLNGKKLLLKALNDENNLKEHKIKIIRELGKTGDELVIPDLMAYINSEDSELSKAALKTLSAFISKKKKISSSIIQKFRILDELKSIMSKTSNPNIRTQVIKALDNINTDEAMDYLLELSRSSDTQIQTECIFSMRYFDCTKYLNLIKAYLHNENPFVRTSAIAVLYKYDSTHHVAFEELKKNISKAELKYEKMSLLKIVNTIKCRELNDFALRLLTENDRELKIAAFLAILKSGNKSVVKDFADYLIEMDCDFLRKYRWKFYTMNDDVKSEISEDITYKILKKNFSTIKTDEVNQQLLYYLDTDTLKKLANIYGLLELNNQYIFVEKVILERNNLNI